jgi:hypothetical protein
MQLVMRFEASDRWTVDLLTSLLKYANTAARRSAEIWAGYKLDGDFHFRHHLFWLGVEVVVESQAQVSILRKGWLCQSLVEGLRLPR